MNDDVHRGEATASIDYHANNRPWRVLLPPVYRYLPQRFVDAFWESGSLMLSSFARFAEHQDDARGDANEGKAWVRSASEERTMGAFTTAGATAYALCGSTRLSRELMSQFEGCDACFEITNIPEFALEVSRQLAGFRQGMSGHCIYGGRSLVRHTSYPPINLDGLEAGVPLDRIFHAIHDVSRGENLLLKEARYASQSEYRLLWLLDKPVQPTITIEAPDARRFCRPIQPEELP